MIRLFQRLLLFSGLQKKRLIRSFLAYLVSSFFEMIPIMAILTVLTGILKQLSGDVMPESTIWISLGIMIVSIVGRICQSLSQCQNSWQLRVRVGKAHGDRRTPEKGAYGLF